MKSVTLLAMPSNHARLNWRSAMQYMVVDSETGLKMVQATPKNFFSSDYCVQFLGTKEQCQAEIKRLRSLTY